MSKIVGALSSLARQHSDLWIGSAFFLGALVLYLRTMPPTVLDGDSGEYQYMAYILGVPHSTGYPLYTLLGKLFTFIPVGDVAYRVNLFSAVFAALTAPVVYWTARRLVPQRVPCVLATVMLTVAPTMWGGAIEAKTYALHLFIGVLVIFLALRWHQEGRSGDFYWLVFVYGLGLTNHPVIRFLAPALVVVIWLNRSRLNWSMLARGAVLVVVPLLLYAYIPVRASQLIAQQDPANLQLYGREDAILKGTITAYYNNTIQGFFNLVTGFDNKYKLGYASSRVDSAVSLLFQQFTLAGIVLAAVGAIASYRRDRGAFAVLLAAAMGIAFISLYVRAESTVYYLSLAYFVLALWIAFGVDELLLWAERVRGVAVSAWVRAASSPLVVPAVLAVLPLSVLLVSYARLDESDFYAPRDFAQAVLHDHLPPHAVVIAPWEVSQPIRYFQFVENERPDLLVVNVSPVQDQFQTMLANARKLHRPFYLVQFTPELKTTPGPRWVQAVPLPLQEEPRPRYRLTNSRIVDQVQVLGYDVVPDPPQPGSSARILVYYRTLARMYPMYSDVLSVGDVQGRPWGDYAGFPGSYYYQTFRWQPGDIYRDAFEVDWPSNAPSGLYTLDLSWYVYDLEHGKTNYDEESKIALGTVRVGDFSTGVITHPQNTPVGQMLAFLGWASPGAKEGESLSAGRGEALPLDLFWRAGSAMSESYTVFVHLADATGKVFATADGQPYDGMYPTNRWPIGETIRDRHTLDVPKDLAPGDYDIEVGMYIPSSGKRLPIGLPGGTSDKMILAHVTVR